MYARACKLLAFLCAIAVVGTTASAQGPPPARVDLDIEILELNRTALATFETQRDLGLFTDDKGQERINMLPAEVEVPALLEELRGAEILTIAHDVRLSTAAGRAASSSAGGEFPLVVADERGARQSTFKFYGTRVDLAPRAIEGHEYSGSLRISGSQVDNDESIEVGGVHVPGLRVHEFEIDFKLPYGQPWLVCGPVREQRTVTKNALGMKKTGHVEMQTLALITARRVQETLPALAPGAGVRPGEQLVFKVQAFEVSRTKMRTLGFDFAPFLTGDGAALTEFVLSLTKNNLAKVVAEPLVATECGRPTTINVGGEFPVPGLPQSALGPANRMPYGTRVDLVPEALDTGRVRASIRLRLSNTQGYLSREIEGVEVPALRVLEIAGSSELELERPVLIRGISLARMESRRHGLARTVTERNDIETILVVTMSRAAEVARKP